MDVVGFAGGSAVLCNKLELPISLVLGRFDIAATQAFEHPMLVAGSVRGSGDRDHGHAAFGAWWSLQHLHSVFLESTAADDCNLLRTSN